MADHYARSLDLLATADQARTELDALHSEPLPTPPSLRRAIAARYDVIRQANKAAEVHALLHVGEQMRDLRSAIEATRWAR